MLKAPVTSDQRIGCHGLDDPSERRPEPMSCDLRFELLRFHPAMEGGFGSTYNAKRPITGRSSPVGLTSKKGFGWRQLAHRAFQAALLFKECRRLDWDPGQGGHIMRQITLAKAGQHEYVCDGSFATGERELVENSWRDNYWGWGPNRDGMNMLGKIMDGGPRPISSLQVIRELRGNERH